MNQDSENFEALRKLMALKRYEQPPPGYFPRLQGTIMARIRQGEEERHWWSKAAELFTHKPQVAWALGMAACGVVALDVVWVKTQPREAAVPENALPAWQRSPLPAHSYAYGQQVDPSQPLHVANWLENTNPNTTAELPSLFSPLDHSTIETEYVPAH